MSGFGIYVLGVLVSCVTGIVSSFVTWWFLSHKVVPKIVFADSISKSKIDEAPEANTKYRFKFYNRGRRSLIDIKITARIRIKGLKDPKTWTATKLALDWSGDKSYEVPLMRPNSNLIYRFFINNVKEFKNSTIYPKQINEIAIKNELLIEDLLRLGDKAMLSIAVMGYDEFSGSRKVFISKPYHLKDIVEGKFNKMKVVPSAVKKPKSV